MRRPLAPCPQYQMRGERVARVCRRGDGRRAVQYLAIANRREIVHRFGRSAAILGGWAWCFACFGGLVFHGGRKRAHGWRWQGWWAMCNGRPNLWRTGLIKTHRFALHLGNSRNDRRPWSQRFPQRRPHKRCKPTRPAEYSETAHNVLGTTVLPTPNRSGAPQEQQPARAVSSQFPTRGFSEP